MPVSPNNKQNIYEQLESNWALAKDSIFQNNFIECRKSYKTNRIVSKIFPKLKERFKKDSEKKLNARILKHAISLVDKKNNPELAKEIKKVKLKNWNEENLTYFKEICTFIQSDSKVKDKIDTKAQNVIKSLFIALQNIRKKQITQDNLSKQLKSIKQSIANDEKIIDIVKDTLSSTGLSSLSSEDTTASSEVTSEYTNTDLRTSTDDTFNEYKTDSNDISTIDDDLSDNFLDNLSESTYSSERTDSNLGDLSPELIDMEEANSALEEPLIINEPIISPETSEKILPESDPEEIDKESQKSSGISYEGVKELYETTKAKESILPEDKADIESTISSPINENTGSKSSRVAEDIKTSIEKLSEEAVEIKGSQTEPILDKAITEEQANVSDAQVIKETKKTNTESTPEDLFKPSNKFKNSLASLKDWEMHRSVSPFIKTTTLSSRKRAKLQKLDRAIYRKAKEAALKQDFELSTIKHLKPIFSNISTEIANQLRDVEANEKELTKSFNKLSALMKAIEDYSNNKPRAIISLTNAITDTYPHKKTTMERSLLFSAYKSFDQWNIEKIKNDERFDPVEFLVYVLETETDLNGAGTLITEYLKYDLPSTEYNTESTTNKKLVGELDVWIPICQLIHKLGLNSSFIFKMKKGFDHAINFSTLNLACEELHFEYFSLIPKAYLDSILFSELSSNEIFLMMIKLQALQTHLEEINPPYLQHPQILLELQVEIMELLNAGDIDSLSIAMTQIDHHLRQIDQWIPTSDFANTDHHISEAITFVKTVFNEAKERTESKKLHKKKKKPKENDLVVKFSTLLVLNSERSIYISFLEEALNKSGVRFDKKKLSGWVNDYIEQKESDATINTAYFKDVFNAYISNSTKTEEAKLQQNDLAEQRAYLLKESKSVFSSDRTIYHSKNSGSERFHDLLNAIGTAFFSELDNQVYEDLSKKLVSISKHVKNNHKNIPEDQQNQLVHRAFKGFIQQNLMIGNLPISYSDYTSIKEKEATLKAHCDVLAKTPFELSHDLPAPFFDDNNFKDLQNNLEQALSICPNIKPEQLSEKTAALIVDLNKSFYGNMFLSVLDSRASQLTHFRWILDISPPLLEIDESGKITANNAFQFNQIFNFLLSSTTPMGNEEIQGVQSQAEKIFASWAEAASDKYNLGGDSISEALDKSFKDGHIFSEHHKNFKLSREFIDLFSNNLKLNSLEKFSYNRCLYIRNTESIKMFLPVIKKIVKSNNLSPQLALSQVDQAIYHLHKEYPCTPLSEIMEKIANPKLSKIVLDLGSHIYSVQSKTLKEFSKNVDLANETYKPLLKLYPNKPKFKRSKHNHLNKCMSNYMGLLNSSGIHVFAEDPVKLLAEYIETSYTEISRSDNYPGWLPFNGYADIVLNTISSRHVLGVSNMDELTSHINDLFNLIGTIDEHQLLDLIAAPLSTQIKEDAASLLTPMLLNGLLNPPISTGQPFIIHNLVKLHKKGLKAIPEGLLTSDKEIALVKKLTTQLLSHVSINTNTVHTIAQSSIPFLEANISEIMGSYKMSFMKFVCFKKGISLPGLESAPDLPLGVTKVLNLVFKASFASGLISLLKNQVADIIKKTLTDNIVSRIEEAMPYCSPDTQKEISSFVKSTVQSILEKNTEFNTVVENLCGVLSVSKQAEIEESVDNLLDSSQNLIVSITNSLIDYAIDEPSKSKQISTPEIIEPLSSGLGQVFEPIKLISPDTPTTPYEKQINVKDIADRAIRYLTANTIENQLEDLTQHLLQDLGLDPAYETGINLLLTYIQDPIYNSPHEHGKQLSVLELFTLYANDKRPIENLEDLFSRTPYLKGIGPFLSSALSCIAIDGNNLENDLTEILGTVFELIQTVTIDRYVNSSLFNESADAKPGFKAKATLEYTSRKCGQILDPNVKVKDPLLEQVHDFLTKDSQEFTINRSLREFLSNYASKYISQSLFQPYSYLDKQLTNEEKKIKTKFPDSIRKWNKALSTNLSDLKHSLDTTKSTPKKKFYNQVISYVVSKKPLPQSILNNLNEQELTIDHLIYFQEKAALEDSQYQPQTSLGLDDPILLLIDDYYTKPIDDQEPISTKLSSFEGFALSSKKVETIKYREQLRIKQMLENYSNLIQSFALKSVDGLLTNLENNPDLSNELLVQFKAVATFFHKKHNLEEPVDNQAFANALNSLYSMIFDNIKSKGLVPSISTLISTVLTP